MSPQSAKSYRHRGGSFLFEFVAVAATAVESGFRFAVTRGTAAAEIEMTALISVGRMPSVRDEWAVKNAAGRAFYSPIPAAGAELPIYGDGGTGRLWTGGLTCTRK